MNVLLDTCVLSELRLPNGNLAVKAAVDLLPDKSLFVSILTIGEIAKGIALLKSGKKRQQLTEWRLGLEQLFADRLVPLDLETASIWGEITARSQLAGITLPAVDGLLAASALRNGLHLMTRNTRHFQATGVMLINPWATSRR